MERSDITQLYGEQALFKYPLADTTEGLDVFDGLLDLSVTLPEELIEELVVTNYAMVDGRLFLSLESGTTAVGHLLMENPTPLSLGVLHMVVPGAAWAVVGPAVGEREWRYDAVEWALDPHCVVPNPPEAPAFKLKVNGVEREFPDVLDLLPNYFLSVDMEERPGGSKALTLRRNDLNIPTDTLTTSLIDADLTNLPLFTIAGRSPDENGMFSLTLEPPDSEGVANVVPVEDHSGNPVGLVFQTRNIPGCPDPYAVLENKIKAGREGHGVDYDLPLDETVVYESSSSSYDAELFPSSSSSGGMSESSSSSI